MVPLWKRALAGLSQPLLKTRPSRVLRSPLRRFVRFDMVRSDSEVVEVRAIFYGRSIGQTVVLRMWKREGIDECFSGGTWIHPFFRGIGIGGRLLRLSIDEAGRRMGCRIFANVNFDNFVSLRLYRRAGFSVVEDERMSKAIENSYLARTGFTKRQVILRHDVA